MLAGIAAPISLLEECAAQSHSHVALTHLIMKSDVYREFYLKMSRRGDYVIVDNSVVEEGDPCELALLLKAAYAVEASEIILPDKIGHGAGTVALVVKALNELSLEARGDFALMAVCHGRSPLDFLSTYIFLQGLSQIQTLGLSMFLDATPIRESHGRRKIVKLLDDWDLVSPRHAYHLLGCFSDLREFQYVNRPWIRSADTGVPVRLGLENKVHPTTARHFGRWNSPPIFEHRNFDFFGDHKMNLAIRRNITLYKKLCGDEEAPDAARKLHIQDASD